VYFGQQSGSKRKRGPSGKFTKYQKGKGKVFVSKGYTIRGRRAISNGELKFHDVDLDDATISATGTVTASINLIPQGVTEITRVGRKCTITSIGWRYHVELAAISTVGGSDTARVIMFLDKQANGATAAVTDVLESADFQSFNNLSNSGRFRTIMDQTVTLNRLASAGDGTANDSAPVRQSGTLFKQCQIPLEFSAGTGAITEIRSNNIGVLLISDAAVTSFESKIRLRFSDG